MTARQSECVVVSPEFLKYLKKLPEDILSFNEAVEEALQTKYTNITSNIPTIPHTLKTSLNPALYEVSNAIQTEFPQSADWSDVRINGKLARIVAKTSGRIFVGPDLCRDEVYLDAAVNYTLDMTAAIQAVGFISPWLRPFLASRAPQVKKLRHRFQQADDFLRPVVTARRQAALHGLNEKDKPDDMLQWLMDSQDKFGQQSDREISNFYNLAATPDLVATLRQEVEEVFAETDGNITAVALQKMVKLDSFLKEIMRYYPQSAIKTHASPVRSSAKYHPSAAFQRKVMKPVTLPNGQTIPTGVILEVPSHAINYDETIHASPDVFDALRFYKIRKEKEAALKGKIPAEDAFAEAATNNQFASVGDTSLAFGYGRNACPGRFFAANEMKMILATTFLKYDLKMPDGCTERYKNLTFGSQSVPDPTKAIMARLRK
ncbi:Cytochrome P450 monooxygenase ATR2 [Colletotrichum aenigma]|uniref:Cytochrome P450 monooxygenase ATR2 n=1 Tax=Colletotrichum aenigma TaxID=1215731 RepID=UPI0018729013|nr:Cytochrome P450 monooxygenase ATR2 [Colletotrichum aenigma]KAF5517830.1 Cytochrome P450 monooxygenase ATR2 [Colletotrichum aenigma]